MNHYLCLVVCDFVFEQKCDSWATAYAAALQILHGEVCDKHIKQKWTPIDVIEAIILAQQKLGK